MALGKKNDDTTTRLTPDERDAMYAKMKQAAIDKALRAKKFDTSLRLIRNDSRLFSSIDLRFGMS